MTERKVRVRFAPSPTGPLHIGGVRTALYNYLFAKKHGGDFILRIEDTDQNRFVPGAEEYIIESLKWLGITPNEGVGFGGGEFAPYKQSERKHMYHEFAMKLINEGKAYYAFDTPEELETMRERLKASNTDAKYDAVTRNAMKNSLTLTEDEVKSRLESGAHYVIRFKLPPNEDVSFHDEIRGDVSFNTSQMDDKVLFKSDGMPTYHLANVADDYSMKVTHVIRGEEWLPSAPLHVLLYSAFGWENFMPKFAHLPLLLKPEGTGKLSKRDGDRMGFPVFPIEWRDPETKEISSGYRESGYIPEAVVNLLAFLGWNPGTEQELFSMEELINAFSIEHIHKAGAHFNPEKAKWFNQQYLHRKNNKELAELFIPIIKNHISNIPSPEFLETVCDLVKERASFVSEFWDLSSYLFIAPTEYDQTVIKKKWNEKSTAFFELLIDNFKQIPEFKKAEINLTIKLTSEKAGIKTGEVMQLIRVIISGRGSGVDLLGMMELLGCDEVCARLVKGVEAASTIK